MVAASKAETNFRVWAMRETQFKKAKASLMAAEPYTLNVLYADGEIVQLSKESVRQHYIETGHHADLYEARQSGAPEPPIPALPMELISSTAELYASMFERLTGEVL